ncbi:hypothetical protein [Lelliottia nimipressuralis]
MHETTTWASLITNLTSVLVSLISVGLGFMLNSRASQRQRKSDERRQSKVLIIQKGEELHQLVSEWAKFVNSHNLLRMSIAEGKITHEQMNDMLDTKTIGRVHDRLDTILRIYFPNLLVNLKSISKEIDKVNDFFNRGGYQWGSVPPEIRESAMQAAKHLEKLQEDLQAGISTLIN